MRCGRDRWHAYIEEAEWRDVVEYGGLRPGSNSCGAGKWFAGTEAAAWSWGGVLDDRFPARVVIVELEVEIVERAYYVDNLDGIGPAAYVEGDDLKRIRIVEVVAHTS